jgi:uncharacterized membrane protein
MGRPNRHLLAAFVGLGLIALVWLIPDLTPARPGPDGGAIEAYRGRIETISLPSSDPNSELPPVPTATVTILDGPKAGTTVNALLAGPSGSQDAITYAAGQEVVVTFTVQADGSDPYVEVTDHWRLPGLGVLALVFAAAVVFVGGWHGVRALVALGLTAVVILKILIPAIIAGVPPVPLAIGVATSVTVVTILLTEGWSRTSLAAILGTTGALAITALLAAVATAFLGFTYTAGSDLAFLTVPGGGGLDLRGVLLAAIILGAVGVLDDVTVTQAVLVEELADKGSLRGTELVFSAMRIGRSHIAATVNTLFLAYVSVGLPLLVVLFVSRQPSAATLNDETIATEIVRTLIGSMGIIAAIPLTTFIAGPLLEPRQDDGEGWRGMRARGLSRVFVAVAGVVLLLGVTVVISLSATPRVALAPTVMDPSSIPGVVPPPVADVASPDPNASPEPNASAVDDTVLYEPGDQIAMTVGGQAVGTITATPTLSKPKPPSTKVRVTVEVTYAATGNLPLDAGRWDLLLADGTTVALAPTSGQAALTRTLTAGESATITFAATLDRQPTDAFAVYTDEISSTMVFGIPVR